MGEQPDKETVIADLRRKREALNAQIEPIRQEIKKLSTQIAQLEFETEEEQALRKVRQRRGRVLKAEPAKVKMKPQSAGN